MSDSLELQLFQYLAYAPEFSKISYSRSRWTYQSFDRNQMLLRAGDLELDSQRRFFTNELSILFTERGFLPTSLDNNTIL